MYTLRPDHVKDRILQESKERVKILSMILFHPRVIVLDIFSSMNNFSSSPLSS